MLLWSQYTNKFWVVSSKILKISFIFLFWIEFITISERAWWTICKTNHDVDYNEFVNSKRYHRLNVKTIEMNCSFIVVFFQRHVSLQRDVFLCYSLNLNFKKVRQLFYIRRRTVSIDRRSHKISNNSEIILQIQISNLFTFILYCRSVDQYIHKNIISSFVFNSLDLSNSKNLWISLKTVMQKTTFKQTTFSRTFSKSH